MACTVKFVLLLIAISRSSCRKSTALSPMFHHDFVSHKHSQELDFKVITVRSERNDGYLRFIRSANLFHLSVEVVGLDEKIENVSEGDRKIHILRKVLLKYKYDKNLVLLFTDSHDAVFTSGKKEILQKFKKSGAKILISAEDYCWSDQTLAVKFFKFETPTGFSYYCSGGIIGYAPALYEILALNESQPITDEEVDYKHVFDDDTKKYNIKLDRRGDLFQNLHGNKKHIELQFQDSTVRVFNTRFQSSPSIIHGNGPSKLLLNQLGNYVPNAWTKKDGCIACNENKIILANKPDTQWPTILIGLYIPVLTPRVDIFLNHIYDMDYPKDNIHLFIHNIQKEHSYDVEGWVSDVEGDYVTVHYEGPDSLLTKEEGRNMGIMHCQKVKCDYYFSVDGSVFFSNQQTLQILIEQNRDFLTPMLSKQGKYWTNFWGDLGQDGFYARSADYLDIVKNVRRGVWTVPFVSDTYLIKSSIIERIGNDPFYTGDFEPEMQFCANLREKGIFMHITNVEDFGQLQDWSDTTFNPFLTPL